MATSRYVISRTSLVGGQCVEGVFGVASRGWIKLVRILGSCSWEMTTLLVLAPGDAAVPGLGLASEGLAIKMVAMAFIQVNIIAYVITRIWNWRFDWLFQPVSWLGCVGLGWVAQTVVEAVFGPDFGLPLGLGLAGAFYLMLMVGFIYSLPWLAGTTRDELIEDVRGVWHRVLRFGR